MSSETFSCRQGKFYAVWNDNILNVKGMQYILIEDLSGMNIDK